MEDIKDKIKKFLSINCNSGYGSGEGESFGYNDGSGYGNGSCYGFNYTSKFGRINSSGCDFGSGSGYDRGIGNGYGLGTGNGHDNGYGYGAGFSYGTGSGSSYGYGYGYGNGFNIKKFNGDTVYSIDDIQTIIKSVHGNYAKGYILVSDLTLTPCFIAKVNNAFAHAKTLREAVQEAFGKHMQIMPIEKRIAEFNRQYPDRDKKVDAFGLFQWHNILTGSCLMGREQFCKEHNLDYKNGKYTVNKFIELTLHTYGGEIIKKLRDSM